MNKQLLLILTTCMLSLNQSSHVMDVSITHHAVESKNGVTQDQEYWRMMIACLEKYPQKTVTYEQHELDCLSYPEQVQACQAYSLLATRREGPGPEQRNAARAKVYSLSHAIKTFILKDNSFRGEIQDLQRLQSAPYNPKDLMQQEHKIVELVTSMMVDQLVFQGHRVKPTDKIG